jgi:hypothetical protein
MWIDKAKGCSERCKDKGVGLGHGQLGEREARLVLAGQGVLTDLVIVRHREPPPPAIIFAEPQNVKLVGNAPDRAAVARSVTDGALPVRDLETKARAARLLADG